MHHLPIHPKGSAVIRTLDLFAGAGGLTTGLAAGSGQFSPVAAVEMDVAAAATYALNHGGKIRDGKIVGGDHVHAVGIEEWLDAGVVPEVDVVVGGPPCQGFSTLNRDGVGAERNLLWQRYAETVSLATPKYFVLENVPAFTKSEQFTVFAESFGKGGLLEDYTFESRVLNAADYGAFQARRRVVVLGWRKDTAPLTFPKTTSADVHPTVAEAFAGLNPVVEQIDLPTREVTFRGKTFPGAFRTHELHVTRRYEKLSLDRFSHIPEDGNRFNIPEHLLSACWKNHRSGTGDVMGRLHWNKPSVTIRTEFFKPEKGRYLHPIEDRAITHLEAAILQGYPLNYRWVGSKVAIARQIGNAVPIPLGKAIGTAIAEAVDSEAAEKHAA
ncbi:DNA cytosine methyltransferase [Promicromonospora sp. NPDC050249]|uniref:DNA cytosine methyltransferase n=1 Tax=Promicromonospora sp. NPDC050249 TaxID=3154743 RepID=UPI0033C32BF4